MPSAFRICVDVNASVRRFIVQLAVGSSTLMGTMVLLALVSVRGLGVH
ncbi:hypothetical protein [Bradyrhizobium sp. AZCC 2230]